MMELNESLELGLSSIENEKVKDYDEKISDIYLLEERVQITLAWEKALRALTSKFDEIMNE